MARSRVKSQKGFTILETLITAAVAGSLAAATFPSWSTAVNAHRLTAGIRTTVGALRAARSAAISRNADVRVTASGASLTTEVYRSATNTWDTIGRAVTLGGGTTVSAVSPSDGLTFHSTGRVDNTVTVTLRNARGDTRQLTVAVLGGVDLS